MKRWAGPISSLLCGSLFVQVLPAAADNLRAALTDAYSGNATVQAQRAEQRQTDEQLPEAESGWRPTVQLTGSIERAHQYFGLSLGAPKVANLTPRTEALTIAQPIYHGGEIGAAVDQANARIAAGADELFAVEQQQLLSAASAYLDLYRDRRVVDLNENLVSVLGANQHDVQATFSAGAATETDTSQARARLAGAVAGKLAAEAQYATSSARFETVVGRGPGSLDLPELIGRIPATQDEALATALQNNPAILRAHRQLDAAQKQVDVANAALLPRVDGIAQVIHQDDELVKGLRQNLAEVGVQATIPLYEGGASFARIRAAREGVNAATKQIAVAERNIHQDVISSWNSLEVAKAQREEFQSQIAANEVAQRDTGKEVTVGTRTRLDVLNAQQELFSSRVLLVGAEHDILLASFQLQNAIGLFTPSQLGLDVADYDPAAHLASVRGKWWGTETEK